MDLTHLILLNGGRFWSIEETRAEEIWQLYANAPDNYLTTFAQIRSDQREREYEREQRTKAAVKTEKGSNAESIFAKKVNDQGMLTLNLNGEIVQSSSSFDIMFGGSTIALDRLNSLIAQAKVDPVVKGLSIIMDSPGGIAIPSRNTARAIDTFGKPFFAYIDNQATSAGYDLIASAQKIVASYANATGSIGTMMGLTNRAKMDEKMGVKRIYLSSGQYKVLGVPGEDGSIPQVHLDKLQSRISQLGGDFLDSVVARRQMSDKIKNTLQDGEVFLNEDAVKMKLVDKLASREEYDKMVRNAMKNQTSFAVKGSVKNMAGEDLIEEPIDLVIEESPIATAEVVQPAVATVTTTSGTENPLLAYLTAKKISNVSDLEKVFKNSAIGEDAFKSMANAAKKYHVLAYGKESAVNFDAMDYDAVREIAGSYREVAKANGGLPVSVRSSVQSDTPTDDKTQARSAVPSANELSEAMAATLMSERRYI